MNNEKASMNVRYTVNDDSTVITVTLASSDDEPLTIGDLRKGFSAVIAQLADPDSDSSQGVH